MKTSIISSIPTVYQYRSIASFGMPVKQHGNGSFSARMDFNTKMDAVAYLIERAYWLSENSDEFKEMKRDINKYGMLSYDAATASIVPTKELDML